MLYTYRLYVSITCIYRSTYLQKFYIHRLKFIFVLTYRPI